MNSFVFDIWLHVGREGRCFSYQDGNNLDIDLGDVVTVRLKGQYMQGLVVKKMKKNTAVNLLVQLLIYLRITPAQQ